jgi:hypothetical protein
VTEVEKQFAETGIYPEWSRDPRHLAAIATYASWMVTITELSADIEPADDNQGEI